MRELWLKTSGKTDADAKQATGGRMKKHDNKKVVVMSQVARKEKSLNTDDI